MRKSILVSVGVAVFLLGFSQPARADMTAVFQVPFLAGNSCGNNLGCSLQLSPDTFLSIDINSFDEQCQHFACGPIEGGTLTYTSPTFSMTADFVPLLSSFSTLLDNLPACGGQNFFIFNWTGPITFTQLNGVTGTGQGATGGDVSDSCNGSIPVATISLDFSNSSFAPVPEPNTIILIATGFALVIFVMKRKIRPARARLVSGT